MKKNGISITGAIQGLNLIRGSCSKKGVNYRILSNVIDLLEELKKGSNDGHNLH